MKLRVAYLTCFLLLPCLLSGQSGNQYSIELDKNFVSWNWMTSLRTVVPTGANSVFTFDNKFNSNLFQRTSNEERWRDENSLQSDWRVSLRDGLDSRSFITSRIFSDDNTGTNFNKHIIGEELIWHPHAKVEIKPALGLAVEQAYDARDQSWYAHTGLALNKVDMGGYVNSTALNAVLKPFPGRSNQEFTFFTGWNKEFSKFARDSIRFGYQFNENRHYVRLGVTPQGDDLLDIEEVLISSRFVSNALQYQPGPTSMFSLLTNIRNRRIDQNNPNFSNFRDELSLENQLQYFVFKGPLELRSGMLFSQKNDQTPQARTDINALQFTFNQSLFYRPGPSDLFWSKLSYTKYEYSTPVTNITDEQRNLLDDRDELRFSIDIGHQHKFSPYFALKLNGNAYLYHQIYLRSGRSASNNWNRILQLSSSADHQMSQRIEHRNEIKILANYTVFDFDEILPRLKSFIFRKLIYSDSISVQLTRNLALINIYQLELEDNGSFFKNEFAQQVTKELTAHYLNISVQHNDVFGLQLTTGLSFWVRNEWSFPVSLETLAPVRTRSREYRSLTPRIVITYPASQRLLVFASYAPNRATNRTFTPNTSLPGGFGISETEQNFSGGQIRLQYSF